MFTIAKIAVPASSDCQLLTSMPGTSSEARKSPLAFTAKRTSNAPKLLEGGDPEAWTKTPRTASLYRMLAAAPLIGIRATLREGAAVGGFV